MHPFRRIIRWFRPPISPLPPPPAPSPPPPREVAPEAAPSAQNGIIACTIESAPGNSELFLVHESGHIIGKLFSSPIYTPSWSADRKRIYFTGVNNRRRSIASVGADGTDQRWLQVGDMESLAPVESPDGHEIAFLGILDPRQDYSEIFVYNPLLSSGSPRRLTYTSRSATSPITGKTQFGSFRPRWTPDSRYIVYSSTQSGEMQIWRMRADGTEQVQLTYRIDDRFPNANAPDVGPDGRIVHWCGQETAMGEIFVMNLDGSGRTRLTESGPNSTSDDPAWSSDGRSILYCSDRDKFIAFGLYTQPAIAYAAPRLLAARGRYGAWK